jgi:hypothetical protein
MTVIDDDEKPGRRMDTRRRRREMVVEVKHENGYYSVYVNGRRMVDRESFTIANNIAERLKTGKRDFTESSEVAEAISNWVSV